MQKAERQRRCVARSCRQLSNHLRDRRFSHSCYRSYHPPSQGCLSIGASQFLLLYFRRQTATVELDGNRVANVHLGGVAEEVAGGVGGDGVAAFEDFQRAALFELKSQALEALAFGAQEALGPNAEIGAALFEAQAERGNFHAKIEGGDAQVERGEAFARSTCASPPSIFA